MRIDLPDYTFSNIVEMVGTYHSDCGGFGLAVGRQTNGKRIIQSLHGHHVWLFDFSHYLAVDLFTFKIGL